MAKYLKICLGFCLLGIVNVSTALDITVTGNWNITIDSDDLVGGAGTDLQNSHLSGSAQITIDISNATSSTDNWQVSISRTGWVSGVSLSVRRTTVGTGPGSISGGTSYLAVTSNPQPFFSGAGDRTNINLQLKIETLSLQNLPNIHSSTVTYTVIDI